MASSFFFFFPGKRKSHAVTLNRTKEEWSMRNCYADPTANTAIANVDRERLREEKRKKLRIQREYEKYLRELEREARFPQKAEGKSPK